MAAPTSSLTFADLQLEIAEKLGVAYYGSDGTGVAQVPIDPQDLAKVNRIVNNGLRMFVADAPKPNGWRWTKLMMILSLWTDDITDGITVSGGAYTAGRTLVTASDDVFYESMEKKTLEIDSVGDFVIDQYVSATSVYVTGNASTASANDITITSNGNFTLPLGFGGQYTGGITYAAGTDRGLQPNWSDEAVIRQLRADTDQQFGTPDLYAVRLMDSTITPTSPRRRWELMAYPLPSETLVVNFPFIYQFDELTVGSQALPAPYGHDEAIKAACKAYAEKDQEDAIDGPEMQYYRQIALPNSYAVDAMSAPKRLGYCGNGRVSVTFNEWREYIYSRPVVNVNL